MAKDRFHQVVKTALAKDGWNITHDPLQIKVGSVEMEIDLGAERLLGAERGDEKIAVEVKSFLASASAISEFHTALGQFINYRAALRREQPDRILYLAVPDLIYNTFFQLDFPQSMLRENAFKLIVYNSDKEQIVLWKEYQSS
ncbi:element excision factor XisH family protein [[Phormidium] sp. ETS-05]|uniref:element excision factor XisH family protein n=1 Tax=[Phormidium] sp. ETS-05 TaxID=222819 RepID=UPI0018EF22E2|nr:element excision factor XisH family protein [[Phormidium] sp. ETS-05]